MQWRLTIFGPHIDDGGCEVYVWFLYCHTMKADYIWSTHWWWRVCSVCVVSILPYNEGWHIWSTHWWWRMCGFYIAIQWRLTIFGPHIDDGGCAVYVISILPYNEGRLYLVHTLMMEGVVFVHMHMSHQLIWLSFMVYWFYFLKKYCTQMLYR